MQPLSDKNKATSNSMIIDVTMQNFMGDVVQASLEIPVLVYFWSSTSAACKQFSQTLEKVVLASGKVKLAKVNIDQTPQIAQQFRIQSIPAIYVLVQGQPVDAFNGIMPEAQIKAFIDKLTGPSQEELDIEAALEHAQSLLQEGLTEDALALLSELHTVAPEHSGIIGTLARAYITKGDLSTAKALLTKVTDKASNDAAIISARAALTLAESGSGNTDIANLQRAVATKSDDWQARYDLAGALFISGQAEEAMEQLLAIIQKNRGWNDEQARKQLLTFFEALGPSHPATLQGRRRLSSLLFS